MMALLLSSVSASAITAGAPPVAVDPFVSARYWRVDNLVYHSSATQIYGFSFNTINRLDGANVYNTPISIMTNLGEQLTTFNKIRIIGRGSGVTTIDSHTYFDFDFGTPITPNEFFIWGNEWDVDYIVSCDISYSDDGTTWTKTGEFHADTQISSRQFADGLEARTPAIWSPNTVTMEDASLRVVSGGLDHAATFSDARILILAGRMPGHLYVHDAHLYVITEVTP